MMRPSVQGSCRTIMSLFGILLLLLVMGASKPFASLAEAAIPELPSALRDAKSDKMVLVDFYSDFCGTCRMMEPHLKALQIKTADRLTLKHVNVGTAPGDQYLSPFRITGTPTYILYNPDGKAVYKMSGLISPVILEKQVLRSLRRLKTVDFPEGTPLPSFSQKPAGEIGDLILLSFENSACVDCKAIQPYLSGFEMAGQNGGLHVVHLDIDTPKGKELMQRFDIKALPTYVLLDNTATLQATPFPPQQLLSRGELFRASGVMQPRLLWDIIRLFSATGV